MATEDLSPEERVRMAGELYESGMTERQVAEEMGVSRTRAVYLIEKAGVEKRPRGRRPQAPMRSSPPR